MSVTRRELLGGAAALAATTVLPFRRTWATPTEADVIVIGAGLSGLNAALLLEEIGARVMLLEGQDRVGGKMLTFSRVEGLPEAGGQSIGPGYGRLIDAAQRSGVVLEDTLPRLQKHPQVTLVLDGAPIPPAAWKDSARNPFPEPLRAAMPWTYAAAVLSKANPLVALEEWFAAKNARHDISVHEFLKAQGATDAMIELAYDTNTSYGNSAHDVSALMMFFVDAFQRAQMKLKPAVFRAQGGNQRIPEAMSKRLKGELRLKHVATAVASDDQGATVHCAGGERFRGKAVICALPFSTLRYLRFDPVLTGLQARAVKTLPHQMVTQTALRVRKKFWESDGLAPSMWTDSPIGRVFAIYGGRSDDEVSSLLVTAYGPKASYLDRLGREAAGRFVVREIERMRPAAKGELEVAAHHSWGLDPFSAGDWAFFAPGTVTQFMPAMFQPHGRVHFCGEQTAVAARGMEGAMESGERAALEVASRL